MAVDSGSGITFNGLATGLDTSSLIAGLMKIERQPLDALQTRRSEIDKQQSLMRDFNSKLLALRDAAQAIDERSSTLSAASTSEELLSYKATSSKDDVVTATANGSATTGTYSVRVEQLACVARRISDGFSSKTAIVATAGQLFHIGFGGTADIDFTIPPGGTSLEQLRDLVNADPDNGGKVRAEILYDGTKYRLVLSGTETGASHDLTVTTNVLGEGGGAFLDATKSQAAQGSRAVVFGVTVARDTNDVEDAIPGVTLHLAGLSSTTDTSDAASVTVARDDDAIADKIDAFVKAYDAVHDFVAGQSPTKDGKAGGPLSGDPTLLGAERLIQSKVGARYLFGAARVTSLGEIGVSFDGSGRLSLDRSKLSKALDADPNAVRTLLSGDGVTDGAATAVARVLEPLVRSGDGALALRDKGFDARLHDFDRQIEQMNTRLDQRETTLRARFTALESLVSSLQSQAGFLSSITTTTSR